MRWFAYTLKRLDFPLSQLSSAHSTIWQHSEDEKQGKQANDVLSESTALSFIKSLWSNIHILLALLFSIIRY